MPFASSLWDAPRYRVVRSMQRSVKDTSAFGRLVIEEMEKRQGAVTSPFARFIKMLGVYEARFWTILHAPHKVGSNWAGSIEPDIALRMALAIGEQPVDFYALALQRSSSLPPDRGEVDSPLSSAQVDSFFVMRGREARQMYERIMSDPGNALGHLFFDRLITLAQESKQGYSVKRAAGSCHWYAEKIYPFLEKRDAGTVHEIEPVLRLAVFLRLDPLAFLEAYLHTRAGYRTYPLVGDLQVVEHTREACLSAFAHFRTLWKNVPYRYHEVSRFTHLFLLFCLLDPAEWREAGPFVSPEHEEGPQESALLDERVLVASWILLWEAVLSFQVDTSTFLAFWKSFRKQGAYAQARFIERATRALDLHALLPPVGSKIRATL